jgi:hypothetical protein
MDVDLESIPNQVGSAIQLADETGAGVCALIYQMLLDTSTCLGEEPLRRMSILFADHNYVVTLGSKHIYIVRVDA